MIDGIKRSDAKERELNELFALVFEGEAGAKALQYLRGMTIERVMGPNFDANALAHAEGQRFIVSIIQQRVTMGRHKEPKLPGEK